MSTVLSGNITASEWELPLRGNSRIPSSPSTPSGSFSALAEVSAPLGRMTRTHLSALIDVNARVAKEDHASIETQLNCDEIRTTYELNLSKRCSKTRGFDRTAYMPSHHDSSSAFLQTSKIIKRRTSASGDIHQAMKSMRQKFGRSVFHDMRFLLLLAAVAVFVWSCLEILQRLYH